MSFIIRGLDYELMNEILGVLRCSFVFANNKNIEIFTVLDMLCFMVHIKDQDVVTVEGHCINFFNPLSTKKADNKIAFA